MSSQIKLDRLRAGMHVERNVFPLSEIDPDKAVLNTYRQAETTCMAGAEFRKREEPSSGSESKPRRL
jgi:hypothetical protein